MNLKQKNVHGLYLEGIRDGNYQEAIHKFTGNRYTQHSTGVKDGKEGFIEFFADFVDRCPKRDIRIIRSLVDGRHVFVQVYQDINNKEREWVTTDFFDTDKNDKLIEHWDVISRYEPNTPSGHTTLDGPREVTDLDKTDENKQLVRAFIQDAFMKGGNPHKLERYISQKQYIQHSKDFADGLNVFQKFAADPDRPINYQEIFLMVGQGNFVATYCKSTRKEASKIRDYCQMDLFRIENGKIVEHWDNAEPVPEVHANSGKF